MTAPAFAANILWGTPEFVGLDAPDTASVLRAKIALTYSESDPQLGVVAERFYPSTWGRNKSEFVYYERDEDGTWSRQGAFTAGPTLEDGWPYNTDAEFEFDSRDSAHAVFEAHHYDDHEPTGDLHIGYVCQGDVIWGSNEVVWVSNPDSTGDNTPHMFLDAARDTLHVSWGKGGTMHYRFKCTDPESSASQGWSNIIPIEELGGGRPVVVTDASSNAVLHLFGGKRLDGDPDPENPTENLPDTTVARHLWGPPPAADDTVWTYAGSEEWARTVVDSIGGPPPTETDFEDLVSVVASRAAGLGGGPYIYTVARPVLPGGSDQVITFSTLDTSTMSWDPSHESDPLVISVQGDGMDSGLPTIATDGTGLHVFWQDRPIGQQNTADLLYHRFTPDLSPSSTGDWGPIANVVPDDPSTSMNPAGAVEGDVLLVAYSRLVESVDCPPGIYEDCYQHALYFREGHMFTDSTTAPMTWSGGVFLDRDFVVPEDSTLTILPGTVIEVASESAEDVDGGDTGRVDIIVRDGGKVVATSSTPDSAIVFRGAEEGAGNWYGIRLENLASAQNGYGFLACNTTGCEYCGGAPHFLDRSGPRLL